MARLRRLVPFLSLLILLGCTSIPYRAAPSTPSPVVATADRLIVLGDDGNLRSMAPDGSNVVPLTTDAGPDVQITQPVASPDGVSLAWIEVRSGQPSVVVASRTGQRSQTIPMGLVPFFMQWDPTSTNIAYLGNTGQGLVHEFRRMSKGATSDQWRLLALRMAEIVFRANTGALQ